MEAIGDVLGEEPPILVYPQVKEGNAAKLHIDLSEDADLLVVGPRGHGGFAELLLGSVSQHVAARTPSARSSWSALRRCVCRARIAGK